MAIRLSFILVVLSASSGLLAQGANPSLDKLDWILGTWDRQNAKPGIVHKEIWQKVSDQLFTGIGVAMRGADTVFVEKLQIQVDGGEVYYVADVQENPQPVRFKFTSWGDQSFVSENPEHDAPKKIAYLLEEGVMTAKVSWDDGGFDAVFVRFD